MLQNASKLTLHAFCNTNINMISIRKNICISITLGLGTRTGPSMNIKMNIRKGKYHCEKEYLVFVGVLVLSLMSILVLPFV